LYELHLVGYIKYTSRLEFARLLLLQTSAQYLLRHKHSTNQVKTVLQYTM